MDNRREKILKRRQRETRTGELQEFPSVMWRPAGPPAGPFSVPVKVALRQVALFLLEVRPS